MVNKLLSSKFMQKLKSIKHLEIIIVALFILMLLAIYFVNFDEKKVTLKENTISSNSDITDSILKKDTTGYINITENYKQNTENNLKNLIFASTQTSVNVYVNVLGGEVIYTIQEDKETSFTSDSTSIIVSGGVVSVNYNPLIDKVIITGTNNIGIDAKLKIYEIVKDYLSINQNKIYLY